MSFEYGVVIYFIGMMIWAEILLAMLRKEKAKIPNGIVFTYNIILWFISMPVFFFYNLIRYLRE